MKTFLTKTLFPCLLCMCMLCGCTAQPTVDKSEAPAASSSSVVEPPEESAAPSSTVVEAPAEESAPPSSSAPAEPSMEAQPDAFPPEVPLSPDDSAWVPPLSEGTVETPVEPEPAVPAEPVVESDDTPVETAPSLPEEETPPVEPVSPAPEPVQTPAEDAPAASKNKIIVLDPGHGISSSLMSKEEKIAAGYTYIDGKGWGIWRHFKSGTMWEECEGSGCTGRAPANGSCWYSIRSGDRNTEPDLNYNNALNAKKHLERLGYTVRLTRKENENPSITQRIKSCYPNGDITQEPDAAAYICIHANAGGGRGSYYIQLSGLYDQSGKPANYIEESNGLGKSINDHIVNGTSLSARSNGVYTGYPELVLFCKSPIPVAYMEIGFYDNASDLNIIRSESDLIGKAIAEGIDAYYANK